MTTFLSRSVVVSMCVASAVLSQPEALVPNPKESQHVGGIHLAKDPAHAAVLERIHTAIADKKWDAAAQGIQALLDSDGHKVVEVKRAGPGGKEITVCVGAHAEATRLVARLPKEGRESYEKLFGPAAAELLTRVKTKFDLATATRLVDRYRFTSKGAAGLLLLAEQHLKEKRDHHAAWCFAHLFQHPSAAELADTKKFQAAVVLRRAGYRDLAERTWMAIGNNILKSGVTLDDKKLTGKEAEKLWQDASPELPLKDWPMFRGNPSRSGTVSAKMPDVTKPLWQRPTVLDKSAILNEVERVGEEAKKWIKDTFDKNKDNSVVPGPGPVIMGSQVIYRSQMDMRAVDLFNNFAGQIAWKSTEFEGALAMVLGKDSRIRSLLQEWQSKWADLGKSVAIVENSIGTLSSDSRFAYAIDNLAVPICPVANVKDPWWKGMNNDLKQFLQGNSVHAYDPETGKFRWRLGVTYFPTFGFPKNATPYSETHFLGAPLPLDRQIMILNERNNGEVRLVRVDPSKIAEGQPEVLCTHVLGVTQASRRYLIDVRRRLSSAHLAAAQGVLICPIHAGTLFGVDFVSGRIAWAYPYHNEEADPRKGLPASARIEWKASAPVIHGDNILFTPPEEGSIHCLNLRDGIPQWKMPRKDDIYLAGVFGDKVLLVGETKCRALDVTSGKELWTLDTGVPSGLGMASGNTYYLPLKRGAKSKSPEICAIDVAKGRIARTVEAKEAAGNLVFYQGLVLSQTPLTIAAYPQEK
jgi:outer membrane protein assembly factor BamB